MEDISKQNRENYNNFELGNKKTTRILYILIVLLLGYSVIITWFYNALIHENKNIKTIVVTTSNEKETLTEQYESLLTEFESLKTDNDTLQARIEAHQNRIKDLIQQLKNSKASSAAQIKQMKDELETLRKIMRHFIVQIDSLNTLNLNLQAENIKVKKDIQEVKQKNIELEQKNVSLNTTVDKAATIKTFNLQALPLSKRSKPVYKISKVSKVKVCFTMAENSVASTGTKDVYIRIARPDEKIIYDSENDLFTYKDDKLVYTAKRQVEYEGKDVDVCIYWKNNDYELIEGTYIVDIFTDGKIIGTTAFELK